MQLVAAGFAFTVHGAKVYTALYPASYAFGKRSFDLLTTCLDPL
jgi:hypothetical protein